MAHGAENEERQRAAARALIAKLAYPLAAVTVLVLSMLFVFAVVMDRYYPIE